MDPAENSPWELPPDTRRPLPEVIEDKIDSLIESGTIKWGVALPNENELARRFGVGRSSVRTALQRLQIRGLVEVNRGVGWRVTEQPPAEVDEPTSTELAVLRSEAQFLDARAPLEVAAARLAAVHATEREFEGIRRAHEAHRDAARQGVAALVRTDEEFHQAVVDAAHNPLLREMYALLVEHARPIRYRRFAEVPSNAERSAEGHALVVQFILHQDPGAGTAMESHVRTFSPRPDRRRSHRRSAG